MKKKLYIAVLMIVAAMLLISCKKKRVWREVGNDYEATKDVQFGVQYKNGTPSIIEESIPLVVIYIPVGDGTFEKALFEADAITPESIMDGLKYYGVLDTNTALSKYVEKESKDDFELVGPGAEHPGDIITKVAEITLKDFTTGQIVGPDGRDVGEKYEELFPDDEFGSMSTYLEAVSESFRENMKLLNCDILFE